MRPAAPFPPMGLLEQQLVTETLPDPAAAVRRELTASVPVDAVRPGQTVAITAGSRGIDALDVVLAAAVAFFKERGALPFITPAMGSHGGATAEGQRAYLEHLGLTEARLDAPIRSGMEVDEVAVSALGVPVLLDRNAMAADHIVLVNRVKAHTKYTAAIESGLFKMLVVGLGKHVGAAAVHRAAVRHGMAQVILAMGRAALAATPVLAGIGLVENAHGALHTLRAFDKAGLEAGECELLRLAKEVTPTLPFRDIDLLIVDFIGKNISGTGMDTNVTGRNRDILSPFDEPDPNRPCVARILVRNLHPDSQGNALGVGFADFTTDRLVDAMDYAKTVTNALTGISPEKAAIPIHFPTDRQCLTAALDSLGDWSAETTRVLRIRDTKHLERVLASPALLTQSPRHTRLLQDADPPVFDARGDLAPFPSA